MKNLKTLVLGLIALAPLAATAQVNAHQRHENRRIDQGVRSGALTAREAARLRYRKAQIHAQEVRARLSGRGLSRAERSRLLREQAALSRDIYRQKHDRARRHR